MVISRYIAREIFLTTFAITVILVLVVVSGRVSSYIADAAIGRLAADLIFPILLARIPEYLELILPLALFLGVLIGLGQLQESSELTVMNACGISSTHVLRVVLGVGVFVACVVASFSFYVTPIGSDYVNRLVASQGLQSDLGQITPDRFYQLPNQGLTVYASDLSGDRSEMRDVFVAQDGAFTASGRPTVIFAERGYQRVDAENGGLYFVLEHGNQYEGEPGMADYRITSFGSYQQLLETQDPVESQRPEEQTQYFHQLLQLRSMSEVSEVLWRLSIPLATLLLVVVAVPLCRTQPRQGRMMRIFPGIGIYIFYMLGLNVTREAIGDGQVLAIGGMLAVHAGVLLLGLIMFHYPSLRMHLFSGRRTE